MASKKRARGSVFVDSQSGKLGFYLYWIDPIDESLEKRWRFRSYAEPTEENRLKIKEDLARWDIEINRGIFRPCEEFPDHKIAAFCRCPNCLVASPMANSHKAPNSLKELSVQYLNGEDLRSTGEKKEIERSSYEAKLKLWRAIEAPVVFLAEDGAKYQLDALSDYTIGELTPEAVQAWLRHYQNRAEVEPVATKYLINILSEIKLALKFGQLKRYWSKHALIDFQGTLLKSTKAELSNAKNKSIDKPFTLQERDRIIEYFRARFLSCPVKKYNGKEKIRLEFLYRFVVIAFNTGLRSPSEMTALEWSDINYSRREISVRKSREAGGAIENQIVRQYTKTLKARNVPINDACLEALKALEKHRQEKADWIFWNPRADKKNPFLISNGWAPLTGEKRIRYAFEKALRDLKIDKGHYSPYAMRHTFTTLILDHTTFSDSKVANLIGDNIETMKRHYAGFVENRWRDEGDLEQMNQFNSLSASTLSIVKT